MTLNTKTSKSLFVSWSQLPDDLIKGFNVTATYVGPCDRSDAAADFKMDLLSPSSRQLNINVVYSKPRLTVSQGRAGSFGMCACAVKHTHLTHALCDD